MYNSHEPGVRLSLCGHLLCRQSNCSTSTLCPILVRKQRWQPPQREVVVFHFPKLQVVPTPNTISKRFMPFSNHPKIGATLILLHSTLMETAKGFNNGVSVASVLTLASEGTCQEGLMTRWPSRQGCRATVSTPQLVCE